MENVTAWEKGGGKASVGLNAVDNHRNGYRNALCSQEEFVWCRDNRLLANVSAARTNKTGTYLKCAFDCFDKNAMEWVL